MSIRALTALAVGFASSPLLAQHHFREIAIEEVLAAPGSGGIQQIEIATINRAVDLTGYQLAIGATLVPLPNITLPADRTIALLLGVTGSGPGQIFLPNAPAMIAVGDSIGIYRGTPITDPANVVDYVAWGTGTSNIATAVLAGAWNSQVDTIRPVPTGSSIAYYGRELAGPRIGPDAFYADGTPTLGAPNDFASAFTLGGGCTPNNVATLITTGGLGNGPWIGESHLIFAQQQSGQPKPLFIALGWRRPAPAIPLDPIGAPGCSLGVNPVVVVPLGVTSLNGELRYTLGPDPVLVGLEYYVQAIVTGLSGNAIGIGTSSTLILKVGSR